MTTDNQQDDKMRAFAIAKELRDVEGLTGPHPRLEGKESSIQREGLLLEAAHCIEALASMPQQPN